ncbi:MAG: RnfABCDGE type electron transport complex subunit B [Dokdonella sp.]
MADAKLVDRIDALLPQTQCTRCGYPACRPYAEAIADGRADIDQCAPGGDDGVAALAQLLGVCAKPVDPEYGVEAPATVVVIDEDICIGCTKCIAACPVDAIVGTGKRMHTIIASECTGCELCIPPCPVDCIAIVPIAAKPSTRAEVMSRAELARQRYEARERRLASEFDASIDAPLPTLAVATESTRLSRSDVLDAISRGRAGRSERA